MWPETVARSERLLYGIKWRSTILAYVCLAQVCCQEVCVFLHFQKHESLLSRGTVLEDFDELLSLVALPDLKYALSNVLAGLSDDADGQEQVVVQELCGHVLHWLREGGAEHEGDAILLGRHVGVADHAVDVGQKPHVQHSIGLVQHQELDLTKA